MSEEVVGGVEPAFYIGRRLASGGVSRVYCVDCRSNCFGTWNVAVSKSYCGGGFG